ncbi:hypothetical protein GCM10009654_56570 [Streptomyces hebeiensis]|uniref:Uncharacterized protein n=1 Tax=Streptomyces hebeiensis TaxID=229486 RepID=A0ABP4FML3_9ACTN
MCPRPTREARAEAVTRWDDRGWTGAAGLAPSPARPAGETATVNAQGIPHSVRESLILLRRLSLPPLANLRFPQAGNKGRGEQATNASRDAVDVFRTLSPGGSGELFFHIYDSEL